MSENLVLTGHLDLFEKNQKNILLGHWCSASINVKDVEYNFAGHHWDDYNKFEKDGKYLKDYYYKLIEIVTNFLNNYHNLNKPTKYWNLIIGPYLANTLTIVWSRWEEIRQILEKKKNININVFEGDLVDHSHLDMSDFINNQFNQYWNHFIYKEILIYKGIKFNEIKPPIKRITKYKNISSVSLEKKLLGYYDKLLCSLFKKQNIILHRSYFGNISNFILNLRLNKFPVFGAQFFDYTYNKKNIKIERPKIIASKNNSNIFEKFFEQLLIRLLPQSYLERYPEIIKIVKKINYNPKIIFSALGFVENDLFKIWTAEKFIEKKEIIFSDHGFILDEFINFNYYCFSPNKYVKWKNLNKTKGHGLPPNIFVKKKETLNNENKKKLLFILNVEPIFPFRIGSCPVAADTLDNFKEWKKIYSGLNNIIKENTILRPPPHNDPHNYWNINKMIKSEIGLNLIDINKKLYRSFKSSKLVINTVPQTTFLETMYYDIPNVVYYNNAFMNLSTDTAALIEEMREKKILFSDPKKMSDHLNNIWDNPQNWWNSEDINLFKRQFKKMFFLDAKDNLKIWENFFKENLKSL